MFAINIASVTCMNAPRFEEESHLLFAVLKIQTAVTGYRATAR